VVKCQSTRSRDQNRKGARQLLIDKLDVLENGEQSRVAIKAAAKARKKASKTKKAKRKYRKDDEGEDGMDGEGKSLDPGDSEGAIVGGGGGKELIAEDDEEEHRVKRVEEAEEIWGESKSFEDDPRASIKRTPTSLNKPTQNEREDERGGSSEGIGHKGASQDANGKSTPSSTVVKAAANDTGKDENEFCATLQPLSAR
jgi:hypothetical protein